MRWPLVPLSAVAEVVSGYGFPRDYQGITNEPIPFFKVADMNLTGNERFMNVSTNTVSEDTLRTLNARKFPPKTIIFPKIGAAIATNKKRMLARPSTIDNNVMGLISRRVVDPFYLFYWLEQFDISTMANIGPVPSMRKSEVEKILLPLPPLSEQRRIVEVLDQADALRRLRAEADAKAQRILPALFVKMFGDPATNPMCWRRDRLGTVLLDTQYGMSAKANADGEGTPIIRMNNIDMAGRLQLGKLKYIKASASDRNKYCLRRGDILFNRTNSKELVGKTGLWSGEFEAVPASYLIRVRVDRSQVLPEFVWSFMNTPFLKQLLFEKARRAIGMANINAKELRSLPVIVPDMNVQTQFLNVLEILRDHLHVLVEREQAVAGILAAVVHRAFSGELTANWREAHREQLHVEMAEQAKLLNLSLSEAAKTHG